MFELSALQGDFCPKRIALTAMLEGHFLRLGGINEDAKCPRSFVTKIYQYI
jgi:hypothetical protein